MDSKFSFFVTVIATVGKVSLCVSTYFIVMVSLSPISKPKIFVGDANFQELCC
jgi:hypothetical protein